jgi:peptide/nickel transport system substrate-binding protein
LPLEDELDPGARITRRDALLGAGGLAIGLGLAACGSGGTTSSGSTGAVATDAATAAASTDGVATAAAASTATGALKRGGNLRLGIAGNGLKDIVDGQNTLAKADAARLMAGFEPLLTFDRNYQLVNDALALSIEPDGPTAYVVKLRQGVEFHNGKTLGADDVIYSLKRLTTKKLALDGGTGVTTVDPSNLKKIDDLTVRIGLLQADGTIPYGLASYTACIVPDGYTSTGKSAAQGQVGTGPFKLDSFVPGKQSVHSRFANYWRTGQPYLDQVTIIDIDDDSARINALIAGQIDVLADVPFAQTALITGQQSLTLFENVGAGWLPLGMRVDQKPFTDVRVRQAFRLIVDRPQMLAQAIAGHGRVANDLYAAFDPAFLKAPQRVQDLDQAKSLLKAAGYEGMKIDLPTNEQAAGMNEMCKVFAQMAKGAGVSVNVKVLDSTTFNNGYLKWTFAPDFWGTRLYLPQVAQGSLPNAPFNTTHWPPAGSDFAGLYKQALAESDEGKRTDILHRMQQEEYDGGGYIISFNNNIIDAYSKKVTGFEKNRGTLNLDSYGRNFADVAFV